MSGPAAAASAPPGWVRMAVPIEVRDGTRLAAFVFRPAEDGVASAAPRPVAWTHNLYHDGELSPAMVAAWVEALPWLAPLIARPSPSTAITIEGSWLVELIAAGYAVAIVDVRGSGASSGSRTSLFSPEEAADAVDVTAWLAAQPWCDGRIAMFGRSYMGANQLVAAGCAPPGLRAIFPEMALFDVYGFVHGGGIFRDGFARHWTQDLIARDTARQIDRLDGEPGGDVQAMHQANRDVYQLLDALRFRDAIDPVTGRRPFLEQTPGAAAAAVRAAGVAVYQLAGWYDAFVRDALQWYGSLDRPQRLVIGPWAHVGSAGVELGAEHVAWYDRWVKGVTGDDDDDLAEPIDYYMIGAPPGERWRATATWPPPEAAPTTWFLDDGRADTVDSCNDGRLVAAPPAAGADRYRVDPTTTSGRATRWTNTYGGPFGYGDLAANDEKGLTYTTAPLDAPLEIAGHPLVQLWIACDGPDVDVFAYLEEVDADGGSAYVTEGALRASHRALAEPLVAALPLPFHRGFAEDVQPLVPGEVVELRFDLLPIARRFQAGHRIRLTLTCADADNAESPAARLRPLLTVERGGARASHLVLPVVGGDRP